MPEHLQSNEAETRYNLIDPLLVKIGWNLADRRSVSFEVPVDGYDAAPINNCALHSVFMQERKLKAANLYEPTFTNFGMNK